MRRLVSAALAGWLWSCPAWGQNLPKDLQLPVDETYLKSPGASQYPEANAIFLSDDVTFEVQKDGSTQYEEHDVIKVFTPTGVEEHKDFVRVYRTGLEKVEILRARTILPDGRVLEIPKSAFNDEPVFPGATSGPNKDLRKLSLRYPAVSPNSIVEFHVRTQRKPYLEGKWWAVSYVQNPDPMVRSTFTIRLPEGSFVASATPGYEDLQPERRVESGRQVLKWTIENSPALPQQAAAPGLLTQMKRLEVSNFRGWPEVRKWFERGFEGSVQSDGPVLKKMQELTGIGEPSEKILQSLGEWVNKKRFLGSALDDFRPVAAGQLVEEDVLNPLDAAILLTSLYRAAGLTCQPVLVCEAPPQEMKKALPRLTRMDYVLLKVGDSKQTWWVDPRRPLEYDAEPPSGFQGGSALSGRNDDQPFESLALSPAERNRVVTEVDARVDSRGRLELRFNTTEHGASGMVFREASRELLNNQKDERDQKLQNLFERIAAGYGNGARVLENYFELRPETGAPVDFAATVAVPNYAMKVGDKMALMLPLRMNAQLVNLAQEEKPRTQPIRLDHPWREEQKLRLKIPEGSRVAEVPPTVQIESPYGSYFATARVEGQDVFYYSRLIVNTAWVPQAEAAELAKFARQVFEARGKLMLEAPGSGQAEKG